MKISDNGIILFSRKLQEKLLLIKIFSEKNGICSGIAKNIGTKKMHNYQIGNLVNFQKYYRTCDQLGTVSCESIRSFQWHIMSDKVKLHSFHSISNLILGAFVEYEAHSSSYNALLNFLDLSTSKRFSWLKYFELEMQILRDAGYGLDFEKCAVTNQVDNLTHVSPKTGRAVSIEGAKNYEHLLLKLPKFFTQQSEPQSFNDIEEAFTLSDYFFQRYIWKHKISEDLMTARNLLKSSFELSSLP